MSLFNPENPPFLTRARRENTLPQHEIRARISADGDGVAAGLLYLWHDHWDEAHEIAQSREGERNHDVLHGILHRREGDFGNADYWFRSAGRHPCFPLIATRVAAIDTAHPAPTRPQMRPQTRLVPAGKWEPAAFVKAVRTRIASDEEFLRAVQAVEIMTFHEWLVNTP